MGRLFDAVAALCGLPPVISFEGQAAMALEFAADECEQGTYPIALSSCGAGAIVGQVANLPHDTLVADWEPLVQSVLADRAAGVPVGRISARFHNALADMALAIARCVAWGKELPIVLTGGCFQNALLTARIRSRLSAAGFQVYTHQKVPPSDGGIALGQVLLCLRQLQGSSHVSGSAG
jgi:hydrogenase maturation protein HypF